MSKEVLTNETNDQLSDLMLDWESRRRKGELVSVESLCKHSPELVDALRDRIAKLARFDRLIQTDETLSLDRGSSIDTTKPPASVSKDLVGQTLTAQSRFRIIQTHAQGGLGEVLLAQDERLGRPIALKRIRGAFDHDPERRERFLREAEITSWLEHPGIVPVHGICEDRDGRPCYAMRFIAGETLDVAIQQFHAQAAKGHDSEQRFALRQLLARFVAACNTVAYAHSKGVIHRDLKPANIMLGPYGETLVVDWGLAKVVESSTTCNSARDAKPVTTSNAPATLAEQSQRNLKRESKPAEDSSERFREKPQSSDSASLTQTGAALGTPAFMSPEQALGQQDQIGKASDIYGLGATLFVLLAGQTPFKGLDLVGILQKLGQAHVPSPRAVNSRVPKPLDAICRKAMAHAPSDRYASAIDLAADIEHWLADEPVTAYRDGIVTRAMRTVRRHRAVVTATSLMAIGLAIASWLITIAVHERSLSVLTREIAVGLEANNWDEAHLAQLDASVAKLSRLAPEQANAERERITAQFTDYIRDELQQPRLDNDAIARVEIELERLAARSSDHAAPLRTLLQQRLRTWEQVFELKRPFENRADIFGNAKFHLEAGAIVPESKQLAQLQNTPVTLTTVPSPGRVRLQGEFEIVAEKNLAFGLMLNAEAEPNRNQRPINGVAQQRLFGYSVLVTNPEVKHEQLEPIVNDLDDAPETPSSRRAVRVQFLRNSIVLREETVIVPEGFIVLTLTREEDHFHVQLGDLAPLEFADPFPLQRKASGTFAVAMTSSVRLLRLDAFRQSLPPYVSPLEHADDLFSQSLYSDAARLYQAAIPTAKGGAALEARYKLAFCNLRLGRTDEATRDFERISTEAVGRWPLLAGCQLWALRAKAGNFDAADAIYLSINANYGKRELHSVAPAELLHQILESYSYSGASYFLHDPQRIRKLERAVETLTLLKRDREMVVTQLIRAYRLIGDDAKALKVAEECVHISPDRPLQVNYPLMEEFYWLLCQAGMAEAALADIQRRLRLIRPDHTSHQAQFAYHKIRVLVALRRWKEAKKLLTEFLADDRVEYLSMNHSAMYAQSWQMLGFVYTELGDEDAAKRAWQRGVYKSWNRSPTFSLMGVSSSFVLSQLIQACLSDELDDTLAEQIHKSLTRSLSGNEQAAQFVAGLGTPTKEYRRMWQTPRGHEWARRISFRDCSFADYVQVPVLLLLHTGLSERTFATDPTPEQDEALWQFCRDLHDAYASGDVGMPEVLQLALTWKGTMNAFGWNGVSPKLQPPLRAAAAYFASLRLQVLNRPKEAAELRKIAAEHSEPESLIRQLSTAE